MIRKALFLFFLLVGLQVQAQNESSLFFSEYIANGYTNALEIFIPTPDAVQLNQYSNTRNGTFMFDFPGGVLLPFDTWVGCRNDVGFPPAEAVLAVADTSWSASGSIWYLSSNAKIELLKNDQVIDVINGDPRNGVVAGVDGALDRHTLIRKSKVQCTGISQPGHIFI